MESIIISQKKLAYDLFHAFSRCLKLNDRPVHASQDEVSFIWTIQPIGYYESDRVQMQPGAEALVFRISKDNVKFRASGSDVINEFEKQWSVFSANNSVDRSAPVFTAAYDATVFPPREADKESDSSDDVLIDVDGNRETFVIGWYDYDTKEWSNRDQHPMDLENMKWSYLPFVKYEKK
jgi:hypothetical protein